VRAALGLKNSGQVFSDLDRDERGSVVIVTPGGTQPLNVINDFGLRNLLFKSRKSVGRRFRRWLSDEVIPKLDATRHNRWAPTFTSRRRFSRHVTAADCSGGARHHRHRG
jgi:prophage antirepressor-like protein